MSQYLDRNGRFRLRCPPAILLTAILASAVCAAEQHEPVKAGEVPAATSEALEKKWGIQVSSLRISAGGYMMDFRYKVLDPEKAAPLGKHENTAYLIDQATGAKFLVATTPKVGPLRQKTQNLAAGKTAFVIFVNPGKYVKAGNKATVVIGDFKVENLVVE